MSLYYEAEGIMANADNAGGSLKSRIFARKDIKNPPATLFALVTETTKWSSILAEVIEKSGLLQLERKLSPSLALLLTHDLLLSKRGVAAPKQHVLKQAVTRHKARLSAELTKIRLRHGFATLEKLRSHVVASVSDSTPLSGSAEDVRHLHPRWVRVNSLKTSLAHQLSSTFREFEQQDTLTKVMTCASGSSRSLYVDEHIPDLIAIHPSTDLSKTPAYINGEIIMQDKASCFPAYLLDPCSLSGDIIDACAAPGNKTTHLAALVSSSCTKNRRKQMVYACERDKGRAETLKKMVHLAGADDLVSIKTGQDFLRLDPLAPGFANVQALLLDPSCSGSGIVGRDDTAVLQLPSRDVKANDAQGAPRGKKRKRAADARDAVQATVPDVAEEEEMQIGSEDEKLKERLKNLSAFQLKLLTHAFKFPGARRITYSTCSVHAEENENVVTKALSSDTAREQGWTILEREHQIDGMRRWSTRGQLDTCLSTEPDYTIDEVQAHTIADACIRCEKGTEVGTMGFFVAAFVRESATQLSDAPNGTLEEQSLAISPATEREPEGEEWNGFSEDDKDD
ncbi:hypothetical protein LTR50_005845 [Elasticomyces elasticus]|nr:hypothetical protein LTR50_005845 [Elasticomyces elasticus]